jgi:superfamily I DNA/RNA helicase/mRNA-degrading endonuclease RelE of RelBE toxin-antitoxin system
MMQFRISDTFAASLVRLTNDEQKQVKTAVFDLQLDPSSPGHQFHRVEKSRDSNFWSVRAGRELRIIVHKTQASILICYVGHHGKAYEWAERRKIEEHPHTGAVQIVEVRELVKEIFVPRYVEQDQQLIKPSSPLFDQVSNADLLGYGVPADWLDDVKSATEDTVFDLTAHLPQEASEALLELATGAKPRKRKQVDSRNSFEHPDAKRRFTLISTPEELMKALDAPWYRWIIFLHPDQRQLAEGDYLGAVRVSGSAGTGKTIVAIHRAVHLLRADPESRVLLTTFSEALANSLRSKLKMLLVSSPLLGERIDVFAFEEVARKLYSKIKDKKTIVEKSDLEHLITSSRKSVPGINVSSSYLLSEWQEVIDAWQVDTWEQYKNATRLGRRKKLSEEQKEKVWLVLSAVQKELISRNAVTLDKALNELSVKLGSYRNQPYSSIVVDEAQDVSVCQLRLLAALGGSRRNGLFFTGDLGQRIFQQPFSWKSVGVKLLCLQTLKINYRTSHQIRMRADGLLAEELSDVDQNLEIRSDTISVFDGVRPDIIIAQSETEESSAVAERLQSYHRAGVRPEEIGVFVRSESEFVRAQDAIAKAGLHWNLLTDNVATVLNQVALGTMHLAKGLEFKLVVIIACDSSVIPNEVRLANAADESELEEIFETERHLLYVACTRARDFLIVSGVKPASEFIQDLLGESQQRST